MSHFGQRMALGVLLARQRDVHKSSAALRSGLLMAAGGFPAGLVLAQSSIKRSLEQQASEEEEQEEEKEEPRPAVNQTAQQLSPEQIEQFSRGLERADELLRQAEAAVTRLEAAATKAAEAASEAAETLKAITATSAAGKRNTNP